jgi:hypothetical protein
MVPHWCCGSLHFTSARKIGSHFCFLSSAATFLPI